MKKVFFVLVFVLSAIATFAQNEIVNTNEGRYYAGIEYDGQNQGQFYAEVYYNYPNKYERVRLSNGQSYVVQKMLDRYRTSTGDTFTIRFSPYPGPIRVWFIVICEFTSNTQYHYWAFREYVW